MKEIELIVSYHVSYLGQPYIVKYSNDNPMKEATRTVIWL